MTLHPFVAGTLVHNVLACIFVASLIPRFSVGGAKREPGTDCLHMHLIYQHFGNTVFLWDISGDSNTHCQMYHRVPFMSLSTVEPSSYVTKWNLKGMRFTH